MPHSQVLPFLLVLLSLKISVFAIPVPPQNGGGRKGLSDVSSVPSYTAQNDQNQNETSTFTQFVTTPTSLAEPDPNENSTTVLLDSNTITPSVEGAMKSSATATPTA